MGRASLPTRAGLGGIQLSLVVGGNRLGTALYYVILDKSSERVRSFLERGIDINIQDTHGRTSETALKHRGVKRSL